MNNISGYIPSNFRDNIRPPILSAGLVFIGLTLTGLGVGLFVVPTWLSDTILPYSMVSFGVAITVLGIVYLVCRKQITQFSQKKDEKSFSNWFAQKYDIKLTSDQLDQLYNYGSTVVGGKKFVTKNELTNKGNILFVLSADELEEAKTELIDVIYSNNPPAVEPSNL